MEDSIVAENCIPRSKLRLTKITSVKLDDPDDTHIERTDDEGSADYHSHFGQPHAFIEPDRQQFIQRLPAAAKVLDCGCGPGMDTERFVQLGFAVVAIDLSNRFVQVTKQRVPAADVRKMDMRHLEFPAGTFRWDVVFLQPAPHSENEIDATLSDFRSVLKPGGLLFSALHHGPRTAWVKTIISSMERETYVQEWDQKDIEAILQKAGFTIIQSRPFLQEGGRYPLLSLLMHT